MTDKDLFLLILNSGSWKTAGVDIQYKIFVEDSLKKIYLLFQGSTSRTDWIENFIFTSKMYKKQSEKYYVHKGLAEAYKSANDSIMKDVLAVRKKYLDYELIFSGHSQGGAFSILAGEDYFYRYGEKVKLITFGAPRILYFKKTIIHFEKAFNSTIQYIQPNDVVPKLPPFPFVYHLEEEIIGAPIKLKELLTNTAFYHLHYNLAL